MYKPRTNQDSSSHQQGEGSDRLSLVLRRSHTVNAQSWTSDLLGQQVAPGCHPGQAREWMKFLQMSRNASPGGVPTALVRARWLLWGCVACHLPTPRNSCSEDGLGHLEHPVRGPAGQRCVCGRDTLAQALSPESHLGPLHTGAAPVSHPTTCGGGAWAPGRGAGRQPRSA